MEYRIYWTVWGVVPLILATIVLIAPAFRAAPEIEILLSDSIPDFLFKANEPISIGYKSGVVFDKDMKVTWVFGGPVYAWQPLQVDPDEKRLVAKLDWKASEKNELGIGLDVTYDSLQVEQEYGWQNVVAVSDSFAKVKFPNAGRYRFRLTVSDEQQRQAYMRERLVEIVPETVVLPEDTIVKIVGPTKGLVGEELVFSATGRNVNFWYWKFGDDRNQDANQPQVVYSYNQEGKYQVSLKTDNPDRWFSHWVEISPAWNADSIPVEITDTTNSLIARYQLDLRATLQAISETPTADRTQFYTLKSKIKRAYLSEHLPVINVWVNEDQTPIDFDSYCQRIHFLEGRLEIDKVTFSWEGDSTYRRIRELYVQQHNLNVQ